MLQNVSRCCHGLVLTYLDERAGAAFHAGVVERWFVGHLGHIDIETYTRNLSLPGCGLHYDLFPDLPAGSYVCYFSETRPGAELAAEEAQYDERRALCGDEKNHVDADGNSDSGAKHMTMRSRGNRVFLGVWTPSLRTPQDVNTDSGTEGFTLQLPWYSECFEGMACLMHMQPHTPEQNVPVAVKSRLLLIAEV